MIKVKGTRKIMIGNTTVIINDVPDDVTDDELKKYALRRMLMNELRKNFIKEVYGNGFEQDDFGNA